LRESLIQQAKVRWSPMPFNWTVVDSIGSDTTRTLVATAQPDPARRSGIVILFADTSGNSVAAIPARTIRAAMDVLIELSRRTTGGADRYPPASRLSGTFSVMHLRYQSPLGRTNDEFKLLARLKSRLRTRGPWDLVDSMPVEGDPRRMHTLQCVAWNAGGIPTSVGLTCSAVLPSDPNRREIVLRMISHSCRGCYSADIVFSSEKTRVFAATDDLARDVLAHLELEQQIYSPQRADRLR
jgi:hypothetical protein